MKAAQNMALSEKPTTFLLAESMHGSALLCYAYRSKHPAWFLLVQ
jgi:hypothetical protein